MVWSFSAASENRILQNMAYLFAIHLRTRKNTFECEIQLEGTGAWPGGRRGANRTSSFHHFFIFFPVPGVRNRARVWYRGTASGVVALSTSSPGQEGRGKGADRRGPVPPTFECRVCEPPSVCLLGIPYESQRRSEMETREG